MNKRAALGLIALILVPAGIMFFITQSKANVSILLPQASTESSSITKTVISADWVSDAKAVDELVLESDLIVRVRVSMAPVTRVLRRELPVWDENNNIVGSTISETLFSDTVFEVLRVYRGEARVNIAVMQTGGFVPGESNNAFEVFDDPLYKVGEEYILFLVNISGDPVQASDRELYRIVNPFGRYRIEGEDVISYGEDINPSQPDAISSIIELEAEIEKVLREPNN